MPLKIIDVAGLKKSGKTTVVENLVQELSSRGYKVGTVKKIHIPGFTIDQEGKDTYRHKQAGAEFVISLAPEEVALIKQLHGRRELSEILDLIPDDTDFLVCEELNENRDEISYIITLNTHFNGSGVIFLDPISYITVKWYLHVRVEDAANNRIIGAKVWIVDNENGTFDENFTTASDGFVWYIVLPERIHNITGNISFNPYWINVSYYDPEVGWVNFTDNPRNISINGTLFEIRKEIFTTPDIIPEFSHILMPLIAIIATFIVFRKKQKKNANP